MKANSSALTIILPIETKVREFHGKMFFAYNAVRAGFEVYAGDQARMWNYADLFPRGIYIDKSVAATRRDWFKKLRSFGHHVVSWDEEGLLFFNPEMYKKLRLDEMTLGMTDLFFCWGDVQKEVILSYHPEMRSRLFVCGNPRFDLMREDYRDIYSEAVTSLRKRYGRIILINTNFAFCNHFRSEADLQEMLKSYPLASEPGYIDGWIDYQRQGFQTFFKTIPEISRRYPDHTIIIRPHPSENHATWEYFSQRHANVVVNAEGNVHEWIMASEVLLHDNCTTAVEAFILGVPAISYREIQNRKYENFLPKELSFLVQTQDELFDIIDQALNNTVELYKTKIWSFDKQQILRRYIAGLEKKTSVQSMLDIIDKSPIHTFSSTNISKRIEWKIKILWRKLLHRYREYLHPPDGYSRQKFPSLSRDEISDVFKLFDRQCGNTTNIAIENIARDIYKIRS